MSMTKLFDGNNERSLTTLDVISYGIPHIIGA